MSDFLVFVYTDCIWVLYLGLFLLYYKGYKRINGFERIFWIFFKSYLSNRSQYCHINGIESKVKSIKYGVPQGSILGPLLFIIYMNDLPQYVKDANITMYADDTSLYKSFNSISQLNEQLIPSFCKVCEWLKSNKLSLNTVKTEFMIIGTRHKLNKLDILPECTPYLIKMNDFEIKRAKVVKYLGLMIDDNLTWDKHIKYISGKIKRNIGVIKRVRSFIPQESLITLYQTMIEPYFRYCNIVWGGCNETLKDKLQVLQNRAARAIKNVKYEIADHKLLLNELGWLNIRNLIKLDLGSFIYKTQNNLIPCEINDYFVSTSEVHSYQTRSSTNRNFYLPRAKTVNLGKSTYYSASKLWNDIPKNIRDAQSLDCFKDKLKTYLKYQQNE